MVREFHISVNFLEQYYLYLLMEVEKTENVSIGLSTEVIKLFGYPGRFATKKYVKVVMTNSRSNEYFNLNLLNYDVPLFHRARYF